MGYFNVNGFPFPQRLMGSALAERCGGTVRAKINR